MPCFFMLKNTLILGDVSMKKLLFLFIFLMIFAFVACSESGTDGTETNISVQADDSAITTTLTVGGMTCQRCVTAINRELSALSGVISVSINLSSGILIVEHEPEVTADEIKDIVILEGFSVE
jgi:copper chaperone CopZ